MPRGISWYSAYNIALMSITVWDGLDKRCIGSHSAVVLLLRIDNKIFKTRGLIRNLFPA